MRTASISRKTAETNISLELNLDGNGKSVIDTGCGFLNHMLTLFARHGMFDMEIKCIGDTDVDYHHTVEDVGICLGTAFREALGEMRGINRYGSTILPMDEALILSAVDISGRAHLSFSLDNLKARVGDFDTELIEEFFEAFVRNSNITLHIKTLDGKNTHHIIEGTYKSVARSLRAAVEKDKRAGDSIPSTKGVL